MAYRILVVEDDETVLAFTVAVLKSDGHHVLTANSVDSARKVLAAEKKTDNMCFVIDVVLQHESGIAFAQELVAANPTHRVLLVSGFTDDVLMMGPENADRVAFLPKPFTKQDLADALDRLCR